MYSCNGSVLRECISDRAPHPKLKPQHRRTVRTREVADAAAHDGDDREAVEQAARGAGK